MHAYALIERSAALPQLVRMSQEPGFEFMLFSLDDAIALSLGLTSYVSTPGEVPPASLCRRPQPKDTLDQLISAWAAGDRRSLEESLGPDGSAALVGLLKSGGWNALRASLWRGGSRRRGGVGYRLDIQGEWALPKETLENREQERPPFLGLACFRDSHPL